MKPNDGCEQFFFLTPNGSQYKQLYRKIIEAIKAKAICEQLLNQAQLFHAEVGNQDPPNTCAYKNSYSNYYIHAHTYKYIHVISEAESTY